MKYEWRKQEKDLYLPKNEPVLITVPKLQFLMIRGRGNPNSTAFSAKVEVLYALSYAIRMMPKQGYTPPGYFEYTVYPLEGVWDLAEESRSVETLNLDDLIYTVMIRQPDFVTEDVVSRALEATRKKKPNLALDEVVFDSIEDGKSIQMLHVGPFADEVHSFARMKKFMQEHNLELSTRTHREIYLTDNTKTEPAKMKTVLRYFHVK
ncbi:GyrI-like domain-containing protein [Paenibacillus terrigena]|uniref:GyrI-like domain-containing protein n=1 Tax=Paenibacillus terrigena TaxID=369333 RepID=UPI0028D49C77|nr:GyrI-like domain-containing protein [Paenibacillus terrigena]